MKPDTNSNWYKVWPSRWIASASCIPDGSQRAEFLYLVTFCLEFGPLPDNDQEIAFLTAIQPERITALRPYLNYLASVQDGRLIIDLALETVEITNRHKAYINSLRGDWRTIRLIVLERDQWRCGYCGQPAQAVDHIQPRSKGGTSDYENLVAACKPCNSRKGARTLAQAGMSLIKGGAR